MDRVKIIELAEKHSGETAGNILFGGPKFSSGDAFMAFCFELIAEVLQDAPDGAPAQSNERDDADPVHDWVSTLNEKPEEDGIYRTSERIFDIGEDLKPKVVQKEMFRWAEKREIDFRGKAEVITYWGLPAETPEAAIGMAVSDQFPEIWARGAVIKRVDVDPSEWAKS